MIFTDPLQLSAASYRFAGLMVESQMRFMLAMTDATFGGRNPFFNPPVARREVVEPAPAKTKTPPIARMAKPRVTPQDVKRKATRQPSAPPAMPKCGEPLHPAE